MPNIDTLLHRLIAGDAEAATEILHRALTSRMPMLLVAAALIIEEPQGLLARAAQNAVTTRDRQLIAVAAAHLDDQDELLDVLVREHLSEFPDNILASWIAAAHLRVGQPTPSGPRSSHA